MEQLDQTDFRAIKPILNAGYKIGATVPRTEGDSRRVVVPYEVYGPIAIAGIHGLDAVLADRSITVLMQRGIDKARINSEVVLSEPVWSHVRAMCYRLALARSESVITALDVVRARQDTFTILSGRVLELYRPLIALAVLASGEGNNSFLSDLSVLVQADVDARDTLDPETRRLFAALEHRLHSAPSTILFPKDLVGAVGGPPEQVGKLLTRYGFHGHRTKDGRRYTVTREQFVEQARRYGYPVELEPEAVAVPEPIHV
jgi:hypothetical protein